MYSCLSYLKDISHYSRSEMFFRFSSWLLSMQLFCYERSCSAIIEIQRRQKIRSIWSHSPLANRESDVSHPHSDAHLPPQKNLKRAFSGVTGGYLQKHSLAFFVCCQIGGACGVFTGTRGWAVVLAVSGRPTDWQPARLSLEDSYWGGVAEWTIRDCDVH